jgi:hypothetical protein
MFWVSAGLKVSAILRVVGFIRPVPNSTSVLKSGCHGGTSEQLVSASGIGLRGHPSSPDGRRIGARLAASTDTGHQDPSLKWALGQPEVDRLDASGGAEATGVAKKSHSGFRGDRFSFFYWDSCQRGRRVGEARLYPEASTALWRAIRIISRACSRARVPGWVALKDGTGAPGFIPPAKYTRAESGGAGYLRCKRWG